MTTADPSWVGLAHDALESVRLEAVRRLSQQGRAFTVDVERPVVQRTSDGGWQFPSESVTINALHLDGAWNAIRDDSVRGTIAGFRSQLQDLAHELDSGTKLGDRRIGPVDPGASSGSELILARYLGPWARSYLGGLRSVDKPDEALARTLIDELAEFIVATHGVTVVQLVLNGLRVDRELKVDGVRLRPLTDAELGALMTPIRGLTRSGNLVPESDLRPPMGAIDIPPDTLLEIEIAHEFGVWAPRHGWVEQVVAAFFLCGYQIGTLGSVTTLERPAWVQTWANSMSFPIGKNPIVDRTVFADDDLDQVVNLARRIPEFGPEETTSQQVSLNRYLRGCGEMYPHLAFLDYAIALESALLGTIDSQSELSYRFRLYGALFLRDERDPELTFEELGTIYQARSHLVHGVAGSKKEKEVRLRARANALAPELARAVIRRSVESGSWPDSRLLDRLALGRAVQGGASATVQ